MSFGRVPRTGIEMSSLTKEDGSQGQPALSPVALLPWAGTSLRLGWDGGGRMG